MRIVTHTIFLLTLLVFTQCKKNVQNKIPACIKDEIQKIQSEKVRNPPAKVYEWKYNGIEYYYITSYCCDMYSNLYDKECNLICHPSGGVTGGGNGKCPDFSNGELIKKIIWEDER